MLLLIAKLTFPLILARALKGQIIYGSAHQELQTLNLTLKSSIFLKP
jgi:hypothetical protein